MTAPEGTTVAFTYDANGRRATLTYPNGATATYTYDTKSRLTSLVHQTSGLATIDSFTYTHDNVDNRLTKAEPDVSFSYSYDLVYRLTGSQPTPETPGVPSLTIEGFTYDQVGNRTTGPELVDTYTYGTDNRFLSASFDEYSGVDESWTCGYGYGCCAGCVKRIKNDRRAG